MAVERAATADFDCVAELFLVARLAQNAVIELFSACSRPGQQLGRAVDRCAFFVAGDQKRDRAFAIFPRLATVSLEMIERGGERTGDTAFHVDRAAAVNLSIVDRASERRAPPGRLPAPPA